VRNLIHNVFLFAFVIGIYSCGKESKKCIKGTANFDECIHNKADVKFNEQDIIDYFFSAGEGSWWAYHTYVEDTFGNVLFDCYDTLHIYNYAHSLDVEKSYTREIYQIFYNFNDKGWNCSLNKHTLWEITVTAQKDDIYIFEGSISGRGQGLGSIFKYTNSYFTGHTRFGWNENEIHEYQKIDTLVVNSALYYDVWSNYILGRTLIDYGHFVCYFSKNIGLVKMINFHGIDGWETNLIDYKIVKP
jgi:hypothetical protein